MPFFVLFWQSKSNHSYLKLRELYNKHCRSDIRYGRHFHFISFFLSQKKTIQICLYELCESFCFKTNCSLIQSAIYCFCVAFLCVSVLPKSSTYSNISVLAPLLFTDLFLELKSSAHFSHSFCYPFLLFSYCWGYWGWWR